jgi:hypothetical protein
MAVFSLTSSNSSVAAEFLRQCCCRRGGQRQATTATLERMVETWFLDADAALLAALAAPAAGQQTTWMRAAQRFVAEAHVTAWVRRQNTAKGLAPPSTLVYQQLEAGFGTQPVVAMAAPAREHARTAAARAQWATRWRRRWRARLGKVRARDELTPLAARAKAGGAGVREHFSGGKRAPRRRPKNREKRKKGAGKRARF